VPKDKQRYVHALYAFARAADDFADEKRYEGHRAEKLAEWEARLEACYRGEAHDPIFMALGETVRRLDIPKTLLSDLLSAFRQDTVKSRYETWDELLDYCRRSADPVGRLVLLVFGYRDEGLFSLSDRICTGLQLANHWQDVAVDLRKDRVYLPGASAYVSRSFYSYGNWGWGISNSSFEVSNEGNIEIELDKKSYLSGEKVKALFHDLPDEFFFFVIQFDKINSAAQSVQRNFHFVQANFRIHFFCQQ
jgi:hypothetical protein